MRTESLVSQIRALSIYVVTPMHNVDLPTLRAELQKALELIDREIIWRETYDEGRRA